MLPSIAFPRGVPTLHTDASGTAPPDAFGPFRVLHQIGVGVLGPVFRAYQPDPGRLVAVKQFRLDLPPESAHRFVAALEALIAADLTHLGITAPLAAGLVDNFPYLAMDFAAAESFDVVVRDYGPAPVAEALRIATQLGGALDFAAAVNVFHGSLHPRDVLVSTDDTRVTGLGIAHALEEVGLLPPIRRPYTAPERIAGLAWDRRADTFSLAALVYEMLFGRRIAGIGRDAAEAIPSTEGLDVYAMRTLFARALAEDPAERFETALAFADALHNAVTQPGSAATPAKSPRTRKKASRPALPLEPAPDVAASVPDAAPALELRAAEPLDRPARELEELPAVDTTHDASTAHDENIVAADAEPDQAGDEPPFGDVELRRAEDDRYTLVDEGESALPETGAEIDAHVEPDARLDAGAVLGPDTSLEPDVLLEPDVPLEPDMPLEPDGSLAPVVRATTEPEAPLSSPSVSPSFSSVALEQSRSAIWPLALALVVGLLVGFAFGYGAGTRARGSVAPQSASAESTAPPAVDSGASAAQAPAAGSTGQIPSSPRDGATAPPQETVPQRPAPAAAPPERRAPERGRLLVRSTPAGARVLVDGRDVGATPVTLTSVAFGAHVVRIAHQGYVAAERRVRIGSAQPAQSIEVELAAARPARGTTPAAAEPERTSGLPAAAPGARAGSLMVDSRPVGARVFVDGRLVGTTPLLLDTVSAGDHAVRLEIDGFSTWSTTTRVVGGQRNRVSGSLEQR